jgi:hypothetical protein
VDQVKLRAWWWHRQGLDGSLEGAPAAAVIGRAGWVRSVGGSNPYLTLFARAGIRREAAEKAAAKRDIHELPAARGCTYVLPAADFALGLKCGEAFWGGDMKTAMKLGVTEKEIDRLCEAVVRALEQGELDPDGIREATGKAVRNLGAEGQKKGVTTTLPIALGRLQMLGEIRRVPVTGRLDQQRYRYALWRPNPLASSKLSAEEAYTEMARRYFTWIGPATLGEFQWFSGLGVKAAKAAIEPLHLAAAAEGSERLMPAADRDMLRAFKPPKEPQYALLSGIDSLVLLRRDLKQLIAPEDARARVRDEKTMTEAGRLTDLPSNGIFDRGRLIGLWEYDPAAESIVWMSFVKRNKAMEQAVARMETFVREDLGDARSFSLDSPRSRAPRIEALRKAR